MSISARGRADGESGAKIVECGHLKRARRRKKADKEEFELSLTPAERILELLMEPAREGGG
jgi:hypothetical protein